MERNRLLFALIILLATFSTCRKPSDPSTLFKDQYPVAVGNKWVYLLVSEFVTDTVTIVVVSQTTYPNDSIVFYTKSFVRSAAVDSGYIISSAKSFSYSMDSTNPYNLFGNLHLTFPMPIHTKVLGQNNTDILTLDTFDFSANVNGKSYNNLYVVGRTESDPWQIHQTVEIKPGVGVVQESLWQSIPGFMYWWSNIYLISYELH